MKSKEFINELFRNPQIAEDFGLFELGEYETNKEFLEQIRSYFGDDACEIITSKPKNESEPGTYVYGYTGTNILDRIPDIIIVLASEDNSVNGNCIFLWRIDD